MSTPAAWFSDAKLGIFIHWGIFCIPAFAPRGRTITQITREHPDDGWAHLPYTEWYANSIRFPSSEASRRHAEVWGNRPYEAFREPFEQAAEAFDADAWASLFEEAGAKYAVLVTKHHDGFVLWPSAVQNPHRPGWQSRRDFVGELAGATRKRGLTFGTYYSGGLDWTFRHHPIASFPDLLACVPYEDDYRAYALAQWRELIDRYGTEVLWNDIAYPDAGDRDALIAGFRAARPDGVINDRWLASRPLFEGQRDPQARAALNERIKARAARGAETTQADSGFGDFRTPEYSDQLEFGHRAWEACRGMDASFGFNAEAKVEDYLTADELIGSFVDIVAHGGNLLLNIGPRADGSVPQVQQDLLRALGGWLKVNGEAIYGSRRAAAATGRTADGAPFRTTRKGDTTYILLAAPPGGLEVELPALTGARAARRLDGGGLTLHSTAGPARVRLAEPFSGLGPHVIAFEGAALAA